MARNARTPEDVAYVVKTWKLKRDEESHRIPPSGVYRREFELTKYFTKGEAYLWVFDETNQLEYYYRLSSRQLFGRRENAQERSP